MAAESTDPGACLSIPREPRWQGEGADARRAAPPVVVPRASRATPQTPLSLPTLRDRADFPSRGVVASLLGYYPTSSAPPAAVAATGNTQTGSRPLPGRSLPKVPFSPPFLVNIADLFNATTLDFEGIWRESCCSMGRT